MFKQSITAALNSFVSSKGFEAVPNVDYSSFEDYHYQTSLAMQLRNDPRFDITVLVDHLRQHLSLEKITITGRGFISMKMVLNSASLPKIPETMQVIVDYCGVNVAKQMHIGHIRSMFIGDFIVRLHQHFGDAVTIFNHVGDYGNQFGFLLNYIIQNDIQEFDNKSLTSYYKLAYAQYKADPVFAAASDIVASKLQNYDPEIRELWLKAVNISLTEAYSTFEEFDLKICDDDTYGESFYAPMCPGVLDDLIQKEIAVQEDDGSVCVKFDDGSVLVLRKSNSNYLYALFDIAAIKYRAEIDGISDLPQRFVYVVDNRQKLHFEQVFKVAKMAGYAPGVELVHVGFGTILGADKKPLKTKSGDSLYLDELLADGKQTLLQNEHFVSMDESYRDYVLNATIIGSLKFYDLMLTKEKDYTFDWRLVLNTEGNSAPYIQYAMARIDSILFKKYRHLNHQRTFNWDHSWDAFEQEIIFKCMKTLEVVEDVYKTYKNQQLVTHVLELAKLVHQYVHSYPVIGADDEKHRLEILEFLQASIRCCGKILGIRLYDSQDRMKATQDALKPLEEGE